MTNAYADQKYTRFLGNRLMMELILGRPLKVHEQRKLFNISSAKIEEKLWGFRSRFNVRDFKVSEAIQGHRNTLEVVD